MFLFILPACVWPIPLTVLTVRNNRIDRSLAKYLPSYPTCNEIAGCAKCLITMELIDVLPPEKIAFIAYNIGVYESVQKFGGLITSGKITNGTDVSKIAELLLALFMMQK